MTIEAFTELSHPTCQAAIAAGSMCNRGGDGIRFGRVIKPNSTTGSFSALAGGAAMAILMVPTVMLTSESALRAVPSKMKAAAFGMGATRAQVVTRIVIPTATPGILTGVMLALARAMGETAPLLFTALFSDYWFEGKLLKPIASLSVLIYNFAGSPFEHQVALAWAASLVLVSIVLVLNIVAQVATRRPEEH